MLENVVFFVLGLAALIAGAEALVRGASRLAIAIGISPLVVGLTVCAFGTSSPEAFVSASATLRGASDIAVGNVVGSNIFNVLVILGLSALVAPLLVHSQLIRQEVPIMIGASLVMLVMCVDERISRSDATLLLAMLIGYTVFLVRQSRAETREIRAEYAEAFPGAVGWDRHWAVQLLLIAGGLALLVAGSSWLVDSATAFARALGVSDLVIGLTIIAAGTSMPEVATSMLAALRGERDIAVGNVIGSNTFNVLGCLGLAGLVGTGGLVVPPAAMNFDLWVMAAVALVCLPVFIAGKQIGRGKALMFLTFYATYVAYLILDAKGHDALPRYSAIMLGFVLPLAIATLIAMLIRDTKAE